MSQPTSTCRARCAMHEAVLLGPFWSALASNAPPDTQLALAGTSRMARDAVLQCAQKATLTLQLSPPPTLATLALLRNSGRTLPTTVIIETTYGLSPLHASRIACLYMPQLSCPAVTSLQLDDDRPWLVDTALLSAISTALPALTKLVLSNVTTPPHLPTAAAPAPAWPSLRTVSVCLQQDNQPAAVSHMLAALGVRAGGGVVSLRLHVRHCNGAQSVMGSMRNSNQMHALRKLNLFGTVLHAREAGALIHNAPALEHLKVHSLVWDDGGHGTAAMCVPWRILEVGTLDVSCCSGLPLGSNEGQPPLILRVMHTLEATYRPPDDGQGVEHLVSTAPGKRRVQLECIREAYNVSTVEIHPTLRALTLTSTGLSNLILDGIDNDSSEDDIEDLVDLKQVGLTITMREDIAIDNRWGNMLNGLRDLPQVTRLEVGAEDPYLWMSVGDDLLSKLPAHVTHVRLSNEGPSPKCLLRMLEHVSRLPHRQAHALRLCVPDMAPGWFDVAVSALHMIGITALGVVEVPDSDW